MKNTILFYETLSGSCPVYEFLESLSHKHHAKAIRNLELLEKFGQNIGRGYISKVRDELWELRIRFANDISRIFYFIPRGNTFVILHGFIKKTQKTPINEINISLKRMRDYLERND